MSSTILEQIRLNHENSEIFERAIGEELDRKPVGQKAKSYQQHKVAKLVDGIVSTNKNLKEQFDDKDGLFKEELANMKGSNMFNSFYATVNSTREYHQRFPVIPSTDPLRSITEVDVLFSGEEVFGKYLDLNSFYLRFCNFPGIKSEDQDYIRYLDRFNSFFQFPESFRVTKQFSSYINDLWNYLADFLFRIQPLIDLQDLSKDWRAQFETKWKAGQVPGWKLKAASSASMNPSQAQPLRLGMFNHPDELESLGLDRLKEGLIALGLKSGGTLRERAHRLWSVRGKKPEDFPAKLLMKKPDQNGHENSVDSVQDDSRKQIAWLEFKVAALCDAMMDIVTATRRHAEKQQARTIEEKLAEIAEEEYGLLPDLGDEDVGKNKGGADGDDEEPLYNPLNLPLGWDGKPIPYWLYKLHGLGVEYKCEICGNQSYWGRRAFDKHFQEWRHAHGMRCLGVPNTKHFHDITYIEDVLALYAKIKDSLASEVFVGDIHEEFEDSEGNVLNRRTYEDLARQGLL